MLYHQFLVAAGTVAAVARGGGQPIDARRVLADLFPHHAAPLDHADPGRDRSGPPRGTHLAVRDARRLAAVVVLGAWVGLESFSCLILADFIWNAWHFASQHGGILRIYGRMGGGGRPVLERWGFRVFVTYTALRTAGWLTGLTEHSAAARATMNTLDYVLLRLARDCW